ncbi:hypothetical protein AURDEDRAFT_175780 [Auricularia subglabra TFB-10046 SS5]|uniref:MYND-type domain-containing protein n=1 Tax=Auricularia subglabra (strain TFB-10046 / SS5) TaxID=717982 RepID=J0D7N6_AURST|nr:hypothetical protein AURDEDRAFT_175780 [Auricularia subglabra TFB-10046 SS5]
MELVTRTNHLAASLASDPAACCPLCLASLADELAAGVTARELDRVRTDGHAFWDACIKAVIKLSEDTAPGIQGRLESTIAVCPSDHDGAGPSADVVLVLINALCRSLHVGLSRGTHSAGERARKRRTAFASSRGYWPNDPAQLFPGGPHRLLRALVHWGANFGSGFPVYVLADLATVALPFVFNTIMGSPNLHADTVALIVDRLRGEPVEEKAGSLTLNEHDLIRRRVTRTQGVMTVALFLNVLQSGPDAGANDLLAVVRPREEDVLHAITDALDFFDYPHTGQYKTLAQVANRLQQHLELPVSVLPVSLLEFRNPELGIIDIIVFLVLTLRLQKRRCSGPGCGLFVHQREAGVVFRPCAGCRVVHYCSRGCQRHDWHGGAQVTHARVCAAIRRLVDAPDYGAVYVACSLREKADTLTFALSHTALPEELKARALNLLDDYYLPGLLALRALPGNLRRAAMHEMFG